MKYDYHIHTEYSYDSNVKADDIILKAISLNYDSIAITEHLDLLPLELINFGLPSFKKYVEQIRVLKTKYSTSPTRIFCGIEAGDCHRFKDFSGEVVAQLDLDVILGAVHFLTDFSNVAVPMKKPLSKSKITDYYLQNLKMVQSCDIHILAHLGVYKRYYCETPDEMHCLSIITDIFQCMIERSIALEINYSAMRKPYKSLLPETWQVELYRNMGGKLFSVGSDSHLLEHFDTDYPDLPSWITDHAVTFYK